MSSIAVSYSACYPACDPHRRFVAALLILLTAMLAACTSPGQVLSRQAQEAGAESLLLKGQPFLHRSYYRPGQGDRLHVYLEGDGTPWIRPTRVATDPTSLNPTALQMMLQDSAPSLYLGRPCYNGRASAVGCSSRFWTHERYSETVVRSLRLALEDFLRRQPFDQLVLIGHSGGGTLAMLLAPRVRQARALLTLAANLDTDRWAGLHAYSPLAGSLNPALEPPLGIPQLHFAGGEDPVVPVSLVRRVTAKQAGARLIVLDGVDHHCCWVALWPQLLQQLDQLLLSTAPAGRISEDQGR